MTNIPALASIQEAARLLNVSTKTLRRWEARGLLIPVRTSGGHRRYEMSKILELKGNKRHAHIPTPKPEVNEVVKFEAKDVPVLYTSAFHPDQKKILKIIGFSVCGVLLTYLTLKLIPSNIKSFAVEDFRAKILGISDAKTSKDKNQEGSVLAASTSNQSPIFNINIQSAFKDNSIFSKDVEVDGNLILKKQIIGNVDTTGNVIVGGNSITTNQNTFNLVNTSAGTLNIGGAATSISLGATTGTTTVNNSLSVKGKITGSGDLAVSGNTTLNGTETVTGKITGSGDLAISGNATFGNITSINGITYSFPTSQGGSSTFLTNNGSGTLTWTTPTLTSLAGTLPIANGGTNNSTAYTAGSVIFSDGTKLTQDNTNLFYDSTNKRLGLGNAAPTTTLDVTGTGKFSSTLTASNGLTLTTGALNLTSTSGATNLTSNSTSGSSFAFTANQLNTNASNAISLAFKNANSGAGLIVNGLDINATGTVPSSGENTENLIYLSGNTLGSNTFNAIYFDTGLSNYVNSSNWTVTAAGAETIASNLGVNGGNITTTQTTANIFTGATTLGIGNAAGTTTVNGALGVTGTANLNGNTVLGSLSSNTVTFTAGVNSNILPSVTSTYNLGSNALRWNNAYAVSFFQNGNAVCDASGLNCPSGAVSYWSQAGGSIYPTNNTFDVFVGGSATNSAKFAFKNVASGTPTASIAGSLANVATYLDGNGNLGTTNAQDLTVGSSSTGNVLINSRGTTALTANGSALTTGGNITISGTATLPNSNTLTGMTNYIELNNGVAVGGATTYFFDKNGNINANNLTVNGTVGSNLVPSATNTYNLGSSSAVEWNNVYAKSFIQNGNLVCDASGANCPGTTSYWGQALGALYPTNNSSDLLVGSTATTSAKFAVINVLTGTPTATISGSTANVATYLDGNGNLGTTNANNLTLGSSSTGNVLINSRGSTALTANGTALSTGGNLTVGGTTTLPNSNTLTGVTNFVQTSGGYSVGGATTYYFNGSGNINANAGTFASTITLPNTNTLTGVANYLELNNGLSVGGATTFYFNSTGDINAHNLSLTGTVGSNLTPTTTDTYNLGTSSTVEWNNVYAKTFTQNGNAVCDASGNCPTGAQYWKLVSGALSPFSDTADVLIGNSATVSAKFAFKNVNSGTPTASIAGSVANVATFIDGNGNLGTTNMRDLTLGSASTGNVILNSRGSTALTANGTALTTGGNLTVGGTTTLPNSNTLTGVTNFVQTSGGFSVGGATTYYFNGSGNINGNAANFASNVGVGTTTPTALLDVAGNASLSGTLAFRSGTGTIQTTAFSPLVVGGNSTGNITLNPSNAVAGGNVSPSVTNVTDLGTSSLLYRNVYATAFNQNGNLVCDASGANCPSASSGGSKWKLASGDISPFSDTLDVLIGSNATTSAKFAFKNVNSGTPTASIAGSTANVATYLDGNGNLGTTNANNLTLGSSSTGNVIVNSRGSTALTANGTGLTTGGNLTIGGTTTLPNSNTLTGVTNFVQTSGGYSIGGGTTFYFNSSGDINAHNLTLTGTVGSNLTPTTTDTYNLGTSSSVEWNNVFAKAFTQNGNLVCDASGANCPTGGSGGSKWQLASGAISPFVTSLDVLIGGTSTSSAKFAFINNATGLPTATIAGNIANVATYLDGNGDLGTTNARNLTLGSASTGNVVIDSRGSTALTANAANLTAGGTFTLPNSNTLTGVTNYVQTSGGYSVGGATTYYFDGSGNLNANAGTFAGNLIANGNSTLGSAITNTITFTGRVAQGSSLIPIGTTGINDLGATSLPWDDVYSNNFVQNGNAVCDASGANCPAAGSGGSKWTLLSGAITPFSNSLDVILGGNSTPSAKLAFININTGTPTATISGTTANVATYLDGNGNLSTTNMANLTLGSASTGNVVVNSRGSTALTANGTALTTGGNLTVGGTTTLPNSNVLTGVTNFVQTSGGFSVGGGTTYYFNGSGNINANGGNFASNVGVGTTSPTALLDVAGNASLSGTLAFRSGAGTIQTTAFSPLVLGGTTTGNITLSPSNDIAGGNISPNMNNVTDLGQSTKTFRNIYGSTIYQGANQVCDVSGNCSSVGNFWGQNQGLLYDVNNTVDLALGASSTTSAKFAVKNILTGIPTATIAGNIANVATYLDGNGNLGTTNANNLTLGSSSTGNVLINSRGSTALTANGTALTTGGNLTVGGTTTLPNSNVLTGVTNFVQTSGGYSVGNGTTFYFNSTGDINAHNLSLTGTVGSNLTPTTTDTYNLGTSSSVEWNNVFAKAFTQNGNLVCDASGANCPSAASGGSKWKLASGDISPFSDTLDVLIGNSATTSAKFAFKNVNSGTPTASIAGSVANVATFIDGNGNISTTNRNNLILGNSSTYSSTGNILLNPSSGFVGIGTTSPQRALHIAGTTAMSILLENTVVGSSTYGRIWDIGNDTSGNLNIVSRNATLGGSGQNAITVLPADVNGISSVGLGTNTPSGILEVRSALNSTNKTFSTTNGLGNNTFVVLDNGSVGVGATSPTALLDVAGAASLSGTLAFRSGTGTIQTTAFSPLVIGGNSTGNITLNPSNAVAGGNVSPSVTNVTDLGTSTLLYRNVYATAFNQNGNLVCDASGANCPSAASGGSKWKLASGDISPFSDTLDVLIGNSATTSAKFAFKNVATGTPTASIAGSVANVATYLDGNGNLSTTNMANLTLGSASTGNVIVNSRGSTALTANGTALTTGGNLTVGGTTTLPNSNILTGVTNYVQTSGGYSVGNGTTYYFDGTGNINANAGTFASTITLPNTNTLTGVASYLQLSNGLSVGGATTYYFNSSGSINANAGTFAGTLTANGNTVLGSTTSNTIGFTGRVNTNIVPSVTATDDLGATSLKWNNVYAVAFNQNGNLVCDASGANCPAATSGGSKWKLSSGAISPFSDTADVLIGNSATTSAKFAFTNVATGLPTASIAGDIANVSTYLTGDGNLSTTNMRDLTLGSSSTGNVVVNSRGSSALTANGSALTTGGNLTVGGTTTLPNSNVLTGVTNFVQTSGGYSVGGATTYYFNSSGNINGNAANFASNVGVGTTSPTALLDVAGNASLSGTLAFRSGTGTIQTTAFSPLVIGGNSTGNITLNPSNAIAGGNVSPSVTNVTDLGTSTLLYRNVYATAFNQNGNLVCDAAGNNCPSAASGGSKWKLASGAISPFSDTLDVLIGNSATTSAKFAFKNVLTGTPTATIAGTTANVATYLDGNGNLGTTNANNLTLGSSSTGNVLLNSRGSTALTANGTALTTGGNLTVGGTTTLPNSNTLTGVTNFVQTSGGYSVGGATTFYFNSTGDINAHNLTLTGTVGSNLTPTTTDTYNLGTSSSVEWNNVFAKAFTQNGNNVCDTSGNCAGVSNTWTLTNKLISPVNNSYDVTIGGSATGSAVQFFGIENTTGDIAKLNSSVITSGNVMEATASAITTGNILKLGQGGNSAFSGNVILADIDNTGGGGGTFTGNFLNFKNAGTTEFTIGATGNVTANGNVAVNGGNLTTTQTTANLFTNATTLGIGNAAGTTTVNGSLTSSGTLTASNGFTLTTGALNLTSTSGTDNLTSTATTGTSYAYTNNSLTGNNANLASFVFKNNNTGAGIITNGVSISSTGSTPSGGTNTENLINLSATALASNTFNGINFGSGLTNYINGTNFTVTSAGNLSASGGMTVTGGTINLNITGTNNTAIGNSTGTITLAGNILPATTDSSNLGSSSSLEFNNVYAKAFSQSGNTVCDSSGNCNSSTGYWGQANGALYPNNKSVDILFGATAGSTATSSAKFAFTGVNSGTPTASIAGSVANVATFIDGNGNISSTNKNNLTLGNSSTYNTTGNILLNPNGTGDVQIGTTGPGASSQYKLNILSTNPALASPTYYYALNAEADNTTSSNITRFYGLSSYAFNNAAGTFTDIAGSNITGQSNNGTVTTLAGSEIFSYAGASASVTNQYGIDVRAYGTGTVQNRYGIYIEAPSGTATNDFGIYQAGNQNNYFGGNIGIGTTTPTALLDVAGNASVSGTLAFRSGTGTIQTTAFSPLVIGGNSTGNITLNPSNAIAGGNVSPSVTNVTDLGKSSLLYRNVYATNFYQGSANNAVCDASGNCNGTAGGTKWKLASGAISPFTDSLDVLIGNSATTSAKFAFKNVASGTPTASIAGSVANVATFIDGNGNISTTNTANLVLGNSSTYTSTGNILLNPSGTGNVGIGTTSPSNRLMVPWVSGDAATTAYFGSSNSSNNQNALQGESYSGFGVLGTSNTSVGVRGVSTSNAGVSGFSTSWYGASGVSTNSVGVFGQSSAGNSGLFLSFSAANTLPTLVTKLVSSGTADLFQAQNSSGNPLFEITSSGNVGVNITSPTALLDVNGNASVSGTLAFHSGTGTIQTTAFSPLVIGGNSTGNITLNPSNAVAGGNISPSVTDVTDLGTSALEFRNTYSNNLITNNTGTANLYNTNATTINFGGAATTALNIGNGNTAYTAINLGSGTGGNTINIGNGANTAAQTVNIAAGAAGANSTVNILSGVATAGTQTLNLGTGASAKTLNLGNSTGATALNFTSGTGSQTFTSSVATTTLGSGAFVFTDNALTTGTGTYFNSSSITTGDLVNINATGTTLTTGNLLNVQNNSSSVFTVGASQITNALPTQFTAAGDVTMAYDLIFTNATTANINSYGPLSINAGPTYGSQNLTLTSYNSGNILLNTGVGGGKVGIGAGITPLGLLTVDSTGDAAIGKSAFVVNQAENQDIFTASASGTTRLVLSNAGNLGIGTNTPGNLLDISSSGTSTSAAMIRTTNTTGPGLGLAIKLGTTTLTGADRFINFLNSSGTIVGKVQALSNTTTTFTGNGTDMAEYFVKDDPNATFATGTVMCQGTNGVKACSTTDSAKIIGIVSATPSFIGGSEGADKALVGLTGQVPVLVDPTSPDLNPGDMITVSGSGLATKATTPGYIIGRVQTPWTSGQTTANVVISNIWADPTLALSSAGDLKVTADTQNPGYSKLTDTNGNTVSMLSGLTSLLTNSFYAFQGSIDHLLVSTGLVSPEVLTNNIKPIAGTTDVNITVGTATISGQLSIKNASDKIVAGIDSTGNATFSGQLSAPSASVSAGLYAGTIYADQIIARNANFENTNTASISGITRDQIETLLNSVEKDQSLLNQAQSWVTQTATGSAALNEMDIKNLFVTGVAALNSASITNSLTVGADMVINSTGNSIDTLSSPLSLQSSGSQPLYLMAGKVKIDTNGNVLVLGNLAVGGVLSASAVSIAEDPNASASANILTSLASAGTAKVASGSADITIQNPNIKLNSLIFVTPTSQVTDTLFVKNEATGSAVIGFKNVAPNDINFNWWIVNQVNGTNP